MKIALVGACGKLGRATNDVLKDFYDVVRIDPSGGDGRSLNDLNAAVDVIVDVSCAEQSVASTEYAALHGAAIVIACTGHDDEMLKRIRSASERVPVFLAYNMAYGVEIFKQAAKFLAQNFGGEIHLHETHHKHKADRPSGTAKEVASALDSLGKSVEISSARGGDVVGEHSLCFYGEGEVIELKHTALSRSAFASGIKRAVEFISKQQRGLFCMSDLFENDE